MNKRLIAVAVAIAVSVPAIAQITPVQIPRVTLPNQATQVDQMKVDVAQDPERARAYINKLQKDRREMREKMQRTLAELQNALSTIDEMTRVGGSLVRAQCASSTLSRTTSGVEENCAASGYTCAPTEGTCHRSCNNTAQCAPGFVCDTGASRCVPPPPPAEEECEFFGLIC